MFPVPDDVADAQKRALDPFVCLAAAASVTQRIAVGTAITLIAQRDPIVTAKQVSTIDYLSGGRVKLGVGFGWNHAEAANHGIDPTQRRIIAREKVLAMKALWTQRVAAYEGDHISLTPSWQWPKPVQRPHPPIYLGAAASPNTFGRVVEYCDGWMPLGAADVGSGIADLRRCAETLGRSPNSIDVIPMLLGPGTDHPREFDLLREFGITTAIVGSMIPLGESEALRLLDRLQPLIGT